MSTSPQTLARDLLDWYRALGVDEALGEVAIDWLARGQAAPGSGYDLAALQASPPAPGEAAPTGARTRPSSPGPTPAPAPAPRAVPIPPSKPTAPATADRRFPVATPNEAVDAALAAARTAASLADLEAALRAFDGCALKATAKNLCFYRGAAQARLMLIGEAPGRDEDIEGKPFVGRAGQLLDKMLAAVGLGEADVHIANTVYWRPPGNRTPSPQETLVCRPFLERQIELVEPEFVALLGGAAANAMLGIPEGIMRLRGNWREIEIGGRRIKAFATLHPAYLLRTPAQKRLAWRDFLAIAATLDGA